MPFSGNFNCNPDVKAIRGVKKMKGTKTIQPVILMLIIMTTMIFGQESEKPFRRDIFTLTLKGAYMISEDDAYIDLYEKTKYAPEGEIEIRFYRNFYFWGSYSLITAKSEWSEWSSKSLFDPDLRWEIASSKHLVSFGLGYFIGLNEPGEIAIKLEAGACLIIDREVSDKVQVVSGTISDTITDKITHVGVIGELGATYGLWKSLFAEGSVSYTYSTETRLIDDEETRIQLGGLKLTIGVGFTF